MLVKRVVMVDMGALVVDELRQDKALVERRVSMEYEVGTKLEQTE